MFMNLFLNVLKEGPLPKHIVVLPDGNRRYGQKLNFDLTTASVVGFFMGDDSTFPTNTSKQIKKLRSSAFTKMILLCSKLNCSDMTLFGWSVDNYVKRTDEELKNVWKTGHHFLLHILKNRELYKNLGIRLRIFGLIDIMPEYLQKMIAEAVFQTKDNNKMNLNMLICYSSRHEITDSVQSIINGVKANEITVEDISGELITKCLYGIDSPPPDMLIRTSGVTRLSNALLWQISNTQIVFIDILWPQLNAYYLAKALIDYQRKVNVQKVLKNEQLNLIKEERNYIKSSSRINNFITKIANDRFEYLMTKRNIQIPDDPSGNGSVPAYKLLDVKY